MPHRFDPCALSWSPTKGFHRDIKEPIDEKDFTTCCMTTFHDPPPLLKKYGKNRKHCVEVTYDVEISEHSGYCSDSYDETARSEVITDTYPLLGCITNDDIDEDGYLVEKYAKMYYRYSEGCRSGNDRCGCGVGYFNFEVRVVPKKKPRKVTISSDDISYGSDD
jgi:hypothetical protein